MVFSDLSSVIYGGITIYIAAQQYRGNQIKLRHDLFDRRFKVYSGLMDLLGFIGRESDIQEEQLWVFRKETADSCFLFKEEIPRYLKLIFDSAVDLRMQNRQLKNNGIQNKAEQIALSQKNADLLKWFCEQFGVSEKKFMSYLSLR